MENEEKKKLTDTQLRVVQGVAGILSAAALILSLWLPGYYFKVPQDSLLNYLFVVVFLLITFGRRRIETNYKIRTNFYSLALIDGILAGITLFVIFMVQLDATTKILICIGIALVIIVLGIIVPYLRYLKRVQNGTLIPVRIPEKTEEEVEKEAEASKQAAAKNSVSSKISEMTKELEQTDTTGSRTALERRIAEMTQDLGERQTEILENEETDVTDYTKEPEDEIK